MDLKVIKADKNVVHCRIHSMLRDNWDLLCVYGPPQHHLRNNFWANLSSYDAQIPTHGVFWVISMPSTIYLRSMEVVRR